MLTSQYGPYVYIGQSRVCPEMFRAITVAYWLAGLSSKLEWMQGGLNASAVAASAKTHNGLCVADLRSKNMTGAEAWSVAYWLLRCGVVANIRGVMDSMTDHFHCVMADPRHAHKTAQDQVTEYRAGGDGLVGDKPFYGPKVPFTTWENSPYYGTSDFDMATPAEVWTAKLGDNSAGKILLATLAKVNALAIAVKDVKTGSGAMKGWTLGHQTDWTARAILAQGEALTKITTVLGQISKGQEVAQADLDAIQATLEPELPTEETAS